MTPVRKLGELYYELGVRTEGLKKDLDQSERAFGKLTSFVLKNPVVALTAVGTAALGAAVKATQMAATIDTAMRKVAAAVPQGAAGLKTLRQELERISLATGKSQDELSGVAEAIARQGADSLDDVAQRLRAVVDVSQASGADMQAVIAGLDQTLDLFGLTAASSTQVLAELFSVTRGGAQLEDTFAALQAAAPGIQKLGLDLGTAARALEKLGQSGLSPKQAAGELKKLAESGAEGRVEIEKLASAIPKAANPMADLARAAELVNNAAENAGPRLRQEINATLIQLGTEILPPVNALLGQLLATIQRFRGGTTKDLQNAFAAIVADGPRVFEAINGKATNQWANTGGQIREVQRALLQLAEAASEGRVDLQQFGVDGLGKLADQVAKFSRQRLFNPEQQAQLTTFLGQITRAQAALVQLNGAAGGRAGRPVGTVGEGFDSDEVRKARIDEANKALDDLAKKREKAEDDLARATEIALEQRTRVGEALVAIGEATVSTLQQLINDYQLALRDAGFGAREIEILTQAKFGVQNVLKDLGIAKAGLAEVARLNAEGRKADAQAAQEAARAEQEARDRAQRAGRTVEDIGRLVLSAADAFGILGDEASKALSAVVNVGAGLTRALSGDLAGGGLQLASGLFTLAGQAFGRDPEAEERRRQHAENLQALKAIAKNTGDLLGVSVSGVGIASIRDALAAELAKPQRQTFGGAIQTALIPRNLSNATGLSFEEITDLAKRLGITLNGTRESFTLFLQALQSIDLEAFGKGFSGQIRKLEIESRLDPQAFAGFEGFLKRLQVLAGPDGAPAIARALEGIDVSTTEGRATAIERLSETLRNIGSLDVDDLGGLSLDQFIEEILAAIEKLREAEPAAKRATDQFADAMEAFGIAVELGSLTVEEKLAKAKTLFAQLFPDLAGELDFADADAFKASIRSIIDGFASDGELTDAEREQIAVLRLLIGAFEGIGEEVVTFVDELDVLESKFRLFNTSLTAQFQETFAALAERFPEIASLLDGIDITTPEGRAELESRIQTFFTQLAADGLTEQESAILEALTRIFGLAQDIADEAANAAEAAAEAEVKRRQRILDNAENQIRLDDVTDPAEQLQIRVRALGVAFPALAAAIGDLDLATQDGRDALEAWIRAMVASPEALEQLADATGQSIEDLLAVLLGLEDGADAATEAVETLADKLARAFEEIDFEVALEGITDPIALLEKYARGISATVPEIERALAGIDLKTASGRRKAEAALRALGNDTTDPALRSAILEILGQIRALDQVVGEALPAGTPALGGRGGAQNVQSASSITEVTANRWLDVMTTELALSRERNTTLNAILATVAGSRVYQPPALGSGAATPASTINNITIPVNFNGPVTTADATELAAELQRAVYQVVTQQLAVELTVAQRLAGRASA